MRDPDAADEHYLYIRVIAPGGSVIDQQYHLIGELKANGFEIALPTKYDGQANVYYGVATRTRKEGTGAAAGSVGVIYCDEITKSAPDIPPFSYMVETSGGTVQAYYLVDVPTTDLRCAELLSQRLGQAVGGDTVWDRARILRVPGFLNVKLEHPEHPRAYLLERNPDLRYSLEELESVLPALPAGDQDLPLREYTGPFDPHVGTPLAQTDQDRLAAFLKDLGLLRNSDGRYAGACPFPHQDGPSTSECNFHCSPITGRWKCFGSLHVGNSTGEVDALRLIGFEAEQPVGGELSLKEMAVLLGTDVAAGFYKVGLKPDVANTVSTKTIVTVSATSLAQTSSRRARKDSLWSDAVRLFAYQKGEKPLVKGTCLYSGAAKQLAVVNLRSNSWSNVINAQFKRRKIYFHCLPKLGGGEVFLKRVPVDDWSRQSHSAIKRQLERSDAEFRWLDNSLRRGHYLYLVSVQLAGWESVQDVGSVLVDGLKGIAPPSRDEDVRRFRPYRGSRGWAGGAMARLEEDANRWHVIAQSDTGADWNQLEAELRASGIWYEEVGEFWKRSQWGAGIVADFDNEAEALDLVVSIGYAPTANSWAAVA